MIPKKIHYCWFGDKPLSELAKKCIESWEKYCPDYEIIQWNESNIDINSVEYMKEAYEEKAWGFVPDVARLELIYNYGGIYLDTDVEIIRPIDELLKNKCFVGIQDGDKNTIALGLGFGAEKGNPLIKILLDDYKKRHFKLPDGTLNRIPSPALQDDLMLKLGFNGKNEIQDIMGAMVYPTSYFCPKSCKTGTLSINENTFSIHHYDGSWRSEDEHSYIESKYKIYQKYGNVLGKPIWLAFRFVNRIKKDGTKGTFILILSKIGEMKK